MRKTDSLVLRLYRSALALYPEPFRELYSEQMLLCARDAYRDARARMAQRLAIDLAVSLVREHLNIWKEEALRRPIVFHSIALILIFTVLGGAAALTTQQMLRRGANQPQEQMVATYANKIAGGIAPQQVIPATHIDVAESLEPFLIFYDDKERPEYANGFLDGSIPTPPPHVLDVARRQGENALTWQPRPGVRIAIVARRIEGQHPGFLLAGRSLRVTEEYEGVLRTMVFGGWVLIVALLIGGAALLERTARRGAPAGA